MTTIPRVPRAKEYGAIGVEPPPLPAFRGEDRVETALVADAPYQRCVVVAFVLAFLAGTGFGELPCAAGWLHTGLWGVTAGGLLGVALSRRAAWWQRALPVAGLVTTVSLIAMALGAWDYGRPAWSHVVPSIVVAILLGGRVLGVRPPSFVPTVIAVLLLHLAAAPAYHRALHTPLWLHLPTAAAEFLLLAVAGYRHALASLLRLPPATYRQEPLCIVPWLDQAWDHPVKISAV